MSVAYCNGSKYDPKIIFAHWSSLNGPEVGRIQLSMEGDRTVKPTMQDIEYYSPPYMAAL